MKKTLLLVAVSFGVLVSCKKNSGSSSSYHVTATIDGKAQTFNVSPLATRLSAFGITEIAIEGFNGTGTSNTQALSIGWTAEPPSTAKFGPGTWSDTSQSYGTIGAYVVSTNEQYVTGSGVTGVATTSGTKGLNDLKITIYVPRLHRRQRDVQRRLLFYGGHHRHKKDDNERGFLCGLEEIRQGQHHSAFAIVIAGLTIGIFNV
ncbi:hypothetical protein [Puia sp.]|uniref:hypothetical protein n=1 Tax=Puia sp. TaxID=2045100 RepID=UPI002F40006B